MYYTKKVHFYMHFLIAASTIFSCNSPISAKATRLLFAACLTAMELSARAAIAWSKIH